MKQDKRYKSLIYTSQATVFFSPSELRTLIRTSQRNNIRTRITGYLYFRKGTFLQFLEGTDQDLQQVFERISGDDRHDIINTIWFDQFQKRLFPHWSMRFIDPSEAEQAQLLEDILIDMMKNQEELGFENEAIVKTIKRLATYQS